LKKPCNLLGTADLWEKVNEKKAELAAKKKKAEAEKKKGEVKKVVGGSKRKATDDGGEVGPSRKKVVVEIPARKKKIRVVEVAEEEEEEEEEEEKELTEGEYRAAVVKLLGQLVEEANGINRSVALHNVLQQRSLAVREKLAARGGLPAEPWVYDGRVRGFYGLEEEWVGDETDEEEETEDEEEEEEADAEEVAEGIAEGGSGEVAEE